MTTFTETNHAGGFLVSEAEGTRSREAITVLSGQVLSAGSVIGRVKRALAAAAVPTVAGGTGTGTMSNIELGKSGQVGAYVVQLITAVANGGVFSVTAPDGTVLPNFTLTPGSTNTTRYTSSHISFSITDATDFVLANSFTITVTAGLAPVAIGTGTGTLSAISMGPEAKNGNYKLTCTTAVTNGGVFSITDPDGNRLPDLTMTPGSTTATAYTSAQINFTMTDATDFIVGDYFNLFIASGSNKVVVFDPTAVDGSEDPYGIAFDNYDATAGDVKGTGVVRDAEVNLSELTWGAAVTAAQKAVTVARLSAERGIACR